MRKKLAVILAAVLTFNTLAIPAFAADEDFETFEIEAVADGEDEGTVGAEEQAAAGEEYDEDYDTAGDAADYEDIDVDLAGEGDFEDDEFGPEVEEGEELVAAPQTYTVVSPTNLRIAFTGSAPDLSQVDELAQITVRAGSNPVVVLTRGEDYTVETVDIGPTTSAKATFTTLNSLVNDKINDLTFTIYDPEKPEEDTYEVTLDESKLVYDGVALTATKIQNASVVVKNGNEKLTNYQYSVSVQTTAAEDKRMNAGTVYELTYTVNGETIYTTTATIAKADLSDLTVSCVEAYSTIYDGKAKTPKATDLDALKVTGRYYAQLTKDDYTVTDYDKNVNASANAVAVVTAKDTCVNYTGSANVGFTIATYEGDVVAVASQPGTAVYTGEALKPEITVTAYFSKDGTTGQGEIPATDYEIVYGETTEVQTDRYSVTLKAPAGNTNIDAFATATGVTVPNAYSITAANMSALTITQKKSVGAGTTIATAEEFAKYFTVKLGEKTIDPNAAEKAFIVEETSKNKMVGDVQTLTVKNGDNANFTGSTTVTFTYEALPLGTAYVAPAAYNPEYTGSTIIPTFDEIKDSTLKDSTETDVATSLTNVTFKVTDIADAVNAGTGKATITGYGDYEGQTSVVEFTIAPASLPANLAVSGIPTGSYFKGQKLTGATVSYGDKKTLTDADCEVYAEEILNLKLTKVLVKGIGNYTGSQTVTLATEVISTGVDMKDATVTAKIPAGLKDAQEDTIKNFLTVTLNGSELASSQYEVNYKTDPKDKSKGLVLGANVSLRITPKNVADGITGFKDIDTTVVARDISEIAGTTADPDAYMALTGTPYTYDGTEKKPTLAINVPTESYAAPVSVGTDFTVSYSDNTDAGTATVTATGKGNYTGTATTTFVIDPKVVSSIGTRTGTTGTAGELTYVVPDATKRQFKVGTPDDLSGELGIMFGSTSEKYVFTTDDYEVKQIEGQSITMTESLAAQPVKYAVTIKSTSKNYTADYGSGKTSFEASYTLVPATVTSADVTIQNTEWDLGDTLSVAGLGTITVSVDGNEIAASNYTPSIEMVDSSVHYRRPSYVIDDVESKYYLVITYNGSYYTGTTRKEIPVGAADTFDINDVVFVEFTSAELMYAVDNRNRGQAKTVKANYIGPLSVGNISSTVSRSNDYFELHIYDEDGFELESGGAVDAGTYKATVNATENYGGAEGATYEFTITQKPLTKTQFETAAKNLNIANVDYAGDATEQPTITGGRNLGLNLTIADFQVVDWDKEWNLSTGDTGKASIGMAETSNYSYDGTYDEATFTWNPAGIDELVAAGVELYTIDPVTYNGQAQHPEIRVADDADVSAEWVTNVTYGGDVTNAYAGTARATFDVVVPNGTKKYAPGTYRGLTLSFTINPADIGTATVEKIPDQVYTGSAIKPEVAVSDASGSLLANGVDYRVAYTNNTNVGTATITITGIQNWSETKTVSFEIVKTKEVQEAEKELADAKAAVEKAAAGTDEATKALAALKNAIENGKALEDKGFDKDALAAAQETFDKADAANKEAAKKAAEEEAAAAETAAKAAVADPTDAKIKAAADAITAADKAIATAKAAGVSDADLKKATDAKSAADTAKASADKEKQQKDAEAKALTDFNTAMGKVPAAASAKESDRAAIDAATKAYNALTEQQKKDASVVAAKAKLDDAQKAIDYPTITFKTNYKSKKVKKNINKTWSNGKSTKRSTVKKSKKKLALKGTSSTGAKITYKTSSKKKATVSSSGVVKFKKKGKVTITATCNNTVVKVLLKIK